MALGYDKIEQCDLTPCLFASSSWQALDKYPSPVYVHYEEYVLFQVTLSLSSPLAFGHILKFLLDREFNSQ